MKQYSLFHVPAWSFFSKDLYLDACFRWKGTGFGYLLFLLTICWIPPIAMLHMGLSGFVVNEAPKVVSQIPTVTIADGKASIAEPQPYYIRDPDSGANMVVIDTTGTITSPDDAKAFALITQTHAILKKSELETRTFSFRDVGNFTLSQEKINGWLDTARKFAAPVCYVVALLGSFINRIVQLLIYACIGMIFAAWCRSTRTYGQLLRLSVLAVTPCIIIKTIITVLQVRLPFAGLFYFAIAMGYLLFGVMACAAHEKNFPPASAQPTGTR